MTSEAGREGSSRPTDAVFWRQEIGTEIQSNNLRMDARALARTDTDCSDGSGAPRHCDVMYFSAGSNIWQTVPLQSHSQNVPLNTHIVAQYFSQPSSKPGRNVFSLLCTRCGHRMAHRKWKEANQQPGTAGPGNMLWMLLSLFRFRVGHPMSAGCTDLVSDRNCSINLEAAG